MHLRVIFYTAEWGACICPNFLLFFVISAFVRMDFCKFCICPNGLLQVLHLSEWTFVSSAFVRMDFCKFCICPNGLLQVLHLSELNFASSAFVRMDFCKFCICPNGLLQVLHLSELNLVSSAFVPPIDFFEFSQLSPQYFCSLISYVLMFNACYS